MGGRRRLGVGKLRRSLLNEERGCLRRRRRRPCSGRRDDRIRPNQILAVGGLRIALPAGERARESSRRRRGLWTPMGLRTLARDEPDYTTACAGAVAIRDRAYHNGAAWPRPGAVRRRGVRGAAGGDLGRRKQCVPTRASIFAGLARRLDLGASVTSELADGDEPWTPRGCPFRPGR
jgi:glycogen debranching enzyme